MNIKNVGNIPEELRAQKCWVCWKTKDRNGKPTKIPINPTTGGQAMSNNPETWSTFQLAINGVARYGLHGIGFMLGNGFVGVDLDHCRNPETGELTSEARDIVYILNSYTEVSPSGTGIHIICRGTLPPGPRRRGNIEMYASNRYFTMTGEATV